MSNNFQTTGGGGQMPPQRAQSTRTHPPGFVQGRGRGLFEHARGRCPPTGPVVWLLFIGLVAAGPVQAEEIRGKVVWQGPPPAPEQIAVKPKAGQKPDSVKGCGHEKESPALRVDPSGGVENVVVWMEGVGAAPVRETVLLDQKACEFFPHVLAVHPGAEIAIRNSDSVVHSVRVFQEGKPAYWMNRWQKVKAPDLHWKAGTPGRYIARCGVHLWMHAWIVVLPAEFFTVSSASGDFRLAGLPSGKRRLHFWHEIAGEWERLVEVAAGGLDLGTVPFPARRPALEEAPPRASAQRKE